MNRRWGVRLLLLALVGGTLLGMGGSAQGADPAPQYQVEQTLTRVFRDAGVDTVVDSRDVTVSVDVTQDLLARQQIHVSWTGAHPSGSRADDPRAEKGMTQEYPVVILQCRGTGDEVVPQTCWTSFFSQRWAGSSDAVWRKDLDATEAQRAEQSDSPDWPDACPDPLPGLLGQYDVPFVAADGTVYPACNAETVAPEMGFNGAMPPNDLAAYTKPDGTGEIDFDVRTKAENESLGCSNLVPCSLVVLPIMGLSCVENAKSCRALGKTAPGSIYDSQTGIDAAVGPSLWWSPSNWRNRFVVPLTFQPPPPPCDNLDTRAPVDFYGSELLNQASLQWAPAYCLDSTRFKYRHNRMSESVGFSTMLRGAGAAALVSGKQDNPQQLPVGYAPVAITGFAIAYALDKPDNAGPITDLRMTPRLLAKLLTQSYTGSSLGVAHEGMGKNPWSMNQDPEFLALNPDANQLTTEAMATLLSLSSRSDVMAAVTAYVQADPDARAFLAGTPDANGMVVNPSYKNVSVPTPEWPLLDEFVPTYLQACPKENALSPYLSLVAAPVTSLGSIALSVLAAQPNVQTRCERSTATDPVQLGKIAPQGWGHRQMLGLVSLGDAERYGLQVAALQSASGTFVAPDDASMSAAVRTASQAAPGDPFVLDPATLRTVPKAYPGTMIVHAASRLTEMDPALAKDAARFVTIATTEGQRPGTGIGELPPGYLPMTSSAAAPLLASATAVAAAVAAQSGPLGGSTPPPVVPPTSTSDVPVGGAAAPTGVVLPGTGDVVDSETVTGEAADADEPVVASGPTPKTEAVRAGPVGRSVPIAIGAGLVALVGAPLLRRIPARRVH